MRLEYLNSSGSTRLLFDKKEFEYEVNEVQSVVLYESVLFTNQNEVVMLIGF